MRIEEELKLDYSDVLFRPKRSTLKSRKDVNLLRTYRFKYSKNEWSGIPIMLLVGFLTPWPYNYWRLKKYNIACH